MTGEKDVFCILYLNRTGMLVNVNACDQVYSEYFHNTSAKMTTV